VVVAGAGALGLSTALGCALAGLSALSPGRFGPMPDDALVGVRKHVLPPPPPPPPVAPAHVVTVPAPAGDVWAALRNCESHGNYADNTGNGYYGAYQFSASTWHSLGYPGLPSDAPPAEQDQAAHARPHTATIQDG